MKGTTYLDSNAVTSLWNWWVNYRSEGSSDEGVANTPFENVVLSLYTIDECMTFPISKSPISYRNFLSHVTFGLIMKDIKVLQCIPLVFKDRMEHDLSSLSNLSYGSNLGSLAQHRLDAVLSQGGAQNLLADIENKERGSDAAELLSSGEEIYEYRDRRDIHTVLDILINDNHLQPSTSKYDFYMLCMSLYVAIRRRAIAGLEYKKPKKNLNQQIDMYHLSYCPYISNFVSDDDDLYRIANAVVEHCNLKTNVLKSKEVIRAWLSSPNN